MLGLYTDSADLPRNFAHVPRQLRRPSWPSTRIHHVLRYLHRLKHRSRSAGQLRRADRAAMPPECRNQQQCGPVRGHSSRHRHQGRARIVHGLRDGRLVHGTCCRAHNRRSARTVSRMEVDLLVPDHRIGRVLPAAAILHA